MRRLTMAVGLSASRVRRASLAATSPTVRDPGGYFLVLLWLVVVVREARLCAAVVAAGLGLSDVVAADAGPEIREQTAVVARAAFPGGSRPTGGSLPMRLRDELGPVFADAVFIGTFGARGRSGIPSAVVMLVTILQFVGQMTGRQRRRWPVGSTGNSARAGAGRSRFDHSVVSEFRSWPAEHGLSRLCFDRVLDHCCELGLVRAGASSAPTPRM